MIDGETTATVPSARNIMFRADGSYDAPTPAEMTVRLALGEAVLIERTFPVAAGTDTPWLAIGLVAVAAGGASVEAGLVVRAGHGRPEVGRTPGPAAVDMVEPAALVVSAVVDGEPPAYRVRPFTTVVSDRRPEPARGR
jgi:hypothetical protein